MDDLRDKIKGGRSFLEKIGKIIPGYSGYKEKLMRQEADKLIREYLVQKISETMGIMRDIIEELSRGMKLKYMDAADRPLKRCEKLKDRIKFADHGYTGWFEPVKMDTDVLDKIYEFDNALVDFAAALDAKAREVKAAIDNVEVFEQGLKDLFTMLEEADLKYNERENFLLQK